jgi:hypothetical protein
LQLLAIDETLARLQLIFRREFLFRVGIHWGENPTCGSVYVAMHRAALSECRLSDGDKALLLLGQLKGLPMHSVFVLVLQV